METSRRTILKSVLATGILHAMQWPGLHAANGTSADAKPLLVVLGPTGNGVQFTQGVLDAVHALGGSARVSMAQLDGTSALDVDSVARMLRQHQGTRLIGFMDDGMYAIFQELARDAGAGLVCLGRHVWNSVGPHESRHAVLAGSADCNMGAIASSILAPLGRTFLLTERVLGGATGLEAVAGNGVSVTQADSASRTFERKSAVSTSGVQPHMATLLGRMAAFAALGSSLDAMEGVVSSLSQEAGTARFWAPTERAATLIMDL